MQFQVFPSYLNNIYMKACFLMSKNLRDIMMNQFGVIQNNKLNKRTDVFIVDKQFQVYFITPIINMSVR